MVEAKECRCSKFYILVTDDDNNGKEILPIEEIESCNTNGVAKLDVTTILPKGYVLASVNFDGKKVATGYKAIPTSDGLQIAVNVVIENIPFLYPDEMHTLHIRAKSVGRCNITVHEATGVTLDNSSTTVGYGGSYTINVKSVVSNATFKGFKVLDLKTLKAWTTDKSTLTLNNIMSDMDIMPQVELGAPIECSGEQMIWQGNEVKLAYDGFEVFATPNEHGSSPVKKVKVGLAFSSDNYTIIDKVLTSDMQNEVSVVKHTCDYNEQLQNDWPFIKAKFESVSGFECLDVSLRVAITKATQVKVNIFVHDTVIQQCYPCQPMAGTITTYSHDKLHFNIGAPSLGLLPPRTRIFNADTQVLISSAVAQVTTNTAGIQSISPLDYEFLTSVNMVVVIDFPGINDSWWKGGLGWT